MKDYIKKHLTSNEQKKFRRNWDPWEPLFLPHDYSYNRFCLCGCVGKTRTDVFTHNLLRAKGCMRICLHINRHLLLHLIILTVFKGFCNKYPDLVEKEMATHSSILAWRIPWTEEPGRLQFMGSQRVRHDWVTSLTHSPRLGGLTHRNLHSHVSEDQKFETEMPAGWHLLRFLFLVCWWMSLLLVSFLGFPSLSFFCPNLFL